MYTPSSDDILEAAAAGDLERLQELEEVIRDAVEICYRMCKDSEGRTTLHCAAGKGMIQICKFFIEKIKVNINIKTQRGDSPLLLAVAMGHISTAKYLIVRVADITMSDSKGMTPLHYAAIQDSRELMRSLLLRGADIESNSLNGTPLQCATERGNVESVRFLLDHGAEPNPDSKLSHYPLVLAILSHSSECLELLLEAGANPNIRSLDLSPLACAALEGETELLRSLLATGADPNLATAAGLTPIEHAASAGNIDMVRMLFPVTQRIPNYPDWSIDAITNYFQSEEATKQRELRRDADYQFAVQKGKIAKNRRDYLEAVKWYSKAILICPYDVIARSDRSLCWVNLHEGAFALHDAEACAKLNPHCPEARYIESAAWMLLENFTMATKSSVEAYRLGEELDMALRQGVYFEFVEMLSTRQLEAWNICLALTNSFGAHKI